MMRNIGEVFFVIRKTYKKEPNKEKEEEGNEEESEPGKISEAGLVPCVAFAEAR